MLRSLPAYAAHFFQTMIVGKTWSRLERYAASAGFGLDDSFTVNGVAHASLRDTVERVIASIPETTPDHIRFWHGDLFFGNMFYDFTGRRIMAIDPRGQLSAGELRFTATGAMIWRNSPTR